MKLWLLEKGVLLAKELGISGLIIESDAKKVVDDLRGGNSLAPENIISDILSLVAGCKDFSFNFTSRSNNGCAHSLAVKAALGLYFFKCFETIPL